MADLKERLRATRAIYENGDEVGHCLRNPAGPEAADALDALEAEVERLQGLWAIDNRFEHDGPRVIDIAYTAFMMARDPNSDDGGPSDWFNDTLPTIRTLIARADLNPTGGADV